MDFKVSEFSWLKLFADTKQVQNRRRGAGRGKKRESSEWCSNKLAPWVQKLPQVINKQSNNAFMQLSAVKNCTFSHIKFHFSPSLKILLLPFFWWRNPSNLFKCNKSPRLECVKWIMCELQMRFAISWKFNSHLCDLGAQANSQNTAPSAACGIRISLSTHCHRLLNYGICFLNYEAQELVTNGRKRLMAFQDNPKKNVQKYVAKKKASKGRNLDENLFDGGVNQVWQGSVESVSKVLILKIPWKWFLSPLRFNFR